MSSARLGARGLGGKKTELPANRSHAAHSKHDRALRRALDHKPAKLRHLDKKYSFSFGYYNSAVAVRFYRTGTLLVFCPGAYLPLSSVTVLGLTVFAATTFCALLCTAAWRIGFRPHFRF